LRQWLRLCLASVTLLLHCRLDFTCGSGQQATMLTPELCSRCYDFLTGFSAASQLPTVLYHGHSNLVLHPTLQDPSTDRAALVMNVTCQPGADVNVNALLAAARAKLPAYMVPTSVRVLSQMPRLPNGKVGAGLAATGWLPCA
jgi:hypothetical protein